MKELNEAVKRIEEICSWKIPPDQKAHLIMRIVGDGWKIAIVKDAEIAELKNEHEQKMLMVEGYTVNRCEAECQARVERIFKDIERHYGISKEGGVVVTFGSFDGKAMKEFEWWQALKEGIE